MQTAEMSSVFHFLALEIRTNVRYNITRCYHTLACDWRFASCGEFIVVISMDSMIPRQRNNRPLKPDESGYFK